MGNVIIATDENRIYGEKAQVKLDKDNAITNILVEGNVRYVGSKMTLYGSSLKYDARDRFSSLENARILSDDYSILGEKFLLISDKEIVCINSEYTTCRDCPASWSIFSHRTRVVMGEYIYIHHAYIRINGVVVMYLPYIILPIKKKRETGLLPPKIGLNSLEGFKYEQPWFWAIAKEADLTLIPSRMGKRGWSKQMEFRYIPRDGMWFDLGGIYLLDEIYRPYKHDYRPSGTSSFRHMSEWEHHFNSSKNFNHHFYYNFASDLDTYRGIDHFSEKRIQGSGLGGSSFIDFRSNWLALGISGRLKQNQLYPRHKGLDHRMVQILPKLSLNLIPYRILQSDLPFFNNITLDLKGDATVFRQTKKREKAFLRNATRYNLTPSLTWGLGRMGPIVGKTRAMLDAQYYHFPHIEKDDRFKKESIFFETEFSFGMEKVFGSASVKKLDSQEALLPAKEHQVSKKKHDALYSDYLGNMPPSTPKSASTDFFVRTNAYLHKQEFKLKHHFLENQKASGNQKFLAQITEEQGRGLFDPLDALREREFYLPNETSKTSLPLSNTVEFQWNNSLIQKKSKKLHPGSNKDSLRDSFDYKKTAFFNLSQGLNLNVGEGDFKNKLTRMFVDTGIEFKSFSSSLQEYYFHTTQDHIFVLNFKGNFAKGDVSTLFKYDSFEKEEANKVFIVGGGYKLSEQLILRAFFDYDYANERFKRTQYQMTYLPYNNCWKFYVKYQEELKEKNISFNFAVNFSSNNLVL